MMTGENTDLQTADTASAAPPLPSFDDEMGAAYDRVMTTNGADRGEDGKFTPAGGKEQAAADGGTGKDGASLKGEEGAGEEGANPPVASGTPAPAHLPGALKAEWANIPETARAALVAHQADVDRKFGDIGKQLATVKPIADRLVEATTKFPAFKGMTAEQLAQGAIELGAVQVALGRNPVGTIMEIATHYRVLPQLAAAFAGAGGGEGGQSQLVAGLEQKIANLQAKLAEVSSPDTVRQTVSMTLMEKDAEKALDEFAKGKEFFADVEADLPHYISKVIERHGDGRPFPEVLADAYDMAIHANPELRVKVQATEAKATAGDANPKRAADARRAASINVKSTSTGKDRPLTDEEAMGAAYDRAMAH